MADNRIGAAFIEVATKGLAKVQSDLNQIKNRLNQTGQASKPLEEGTKKAGQAAGQAEGMFAKLGNTINGIGAVAARTFFGATAAIGGFTRMASPREFDDLQFALARVAIQVGRIFLPLLRELTEWLNRVADWFRGLSDVQRESILRWVRIGLAVAAVLMILPRVVTAIRAVQAAFALLGAETAIASGGLTLLLGALAAAVPLLISLFGSMNEEGGGDVFGPITDALKQLWEMVRGIFTQLGQFIAGVFRQLAPVIQQVVAVWTQVFQQLFQALNTIFQALLPVVGRIVNAIMEGMRSLIPIVLQVVQTIGNIFQTVAPVIGQILAVIGGVIERVVPIFFAVYRAFETIILRIVQAWERLMPPIMALISQVVDMVTSVLFPILETIGETISQVLDAFVPLFEQIIDAMVPVYQAVIEVLQELLEAVQPLIPVFTDIIETIIESVVPVLQTMANVLSVVISIVAEVFRVLIAVLRPVIRVITALLRPAFELIASVIRTVVNAMIRVINAFIDAINGFVDWYNDQDWLPGHLNRLNRLEEQGERAERRRREEERREDQHEQAQHGARLENNRRADPDRFRGEVRQKAPELIGLAEVWKKVQTAQAQDLQSRIQREQLEESRRGNRALDDIRENTRPRNGWEGAGGDF